MEYKFVELFERFDVEITRSTRETFKVIGVEAANRDEAIKSAMDIYSSAQDDDSRFIEKVVDTTTSCTKVDNGLPF